MISSHIQINKVTLKG